MSRTRSKCTKELLRKSITSFARDYKQYVIESLQRLVATIEQEIRGAFPATIRQTVSDFFKRMSGGDTSSLEEFQERLETIQDIRKRRKIQEKFDDIDLLQHIIQGQIGILDIDMNDFDAPDGDGARNRDAAREKVIEFDNCCISSESFALGNIFQRERVQQLKDILIATVAYFNHLVGQEGQLKVDLIENAEVTRELTARLTAINNHEPLNKEALQETIRTKTNLLEQLKTEQRELEAKLEQLSRDETPTALPPITPTPSPIISRGWWEKWDSSAQSYKFDIQSDVPLVKVEKSAPTRGSAMSSWMWLHPFTPLAYLAEKVLNGSDEIGELWSGVYNDEKNDAESLAQGKYSVTYIPCWHNFDESRIRVTPYVARKNHRDTHIEEQQIRDRIGPDPERVALNNDIHDQGLKMRIWRIGKEIESLKQRLDDARLEEENRDREIVTLKTDLEASRERHETIKNSSLETAGLLNQYNNFCQLVMRVLKSLSWESEQGFSTFYRHFSQRRER